MTSEALGYPFSLFSLAGRTAIVTGVGPGMGRSVALAYAAAGAQVVLCARSPDRLQGVTDEIESAGGQALCLAGDVGTEKGVSTVVDGALDRFGGVDIVFNNAHHNPAFSPLRESDDNLPTTQRMPDRGPLDMTREDWVAALDVNVLAPYYFAQKLLPSMRKRGSGSIITMISNAAVTPSRTEMMVYGATKAALTATTQYLAKIAAPEVRVNAICPGAMTLDGVTTELFKPVAAAIPLKRVGSAHEIVGAALFLASDASSYMTGEALRSDGGRLHAGG